MNSTNRPRTVLREYIDVTIGLTLSGIGVTLVKLLLMLIGVAVVASIVNPATLQNPAIFTVIKILTYALVVLTAVLILLENQAMARLLGWRNILRYRSLQVQRQWTRMRLGLILAGSTGSWSIGRFLPRSRVLYWLVEHVIQMHMHWADVYISSFDIEEKMLYLLANTQETRVEVEKDMRNVREQAAVTSAEIRKLLEDIREGKRQWLEMAPNEAADVIERIREVLRSIRARPLHR